MALRDESHDVVWVSETEQRGESDESIWARASQEKRILITADLDFPLRGPKPVAMVLVRGYERISTTALATLLLEAINSHGDRLEGQLLIVSPGRVRTRTL